MKIAAVVLGAAWLLASCTAEPVAHSDRSYGGTSQRGFVLMSLGAANDAPDLIHYNVVLRRVPNGTETSILFTKGSLLVQGTAPDFTEDGRPGAVYHFQLPPGDYEVVYYRVFRPPAFSPDRPEPFSVQQGRTTYLGRFWVGLKIERGAAVAEGRRIDRLSDDLDIARKRFADQLAANPIIDMRP